MFLYSVFLVETTAFYKQDTDKSQIEPISYINYTFSHWQIHSCLIEPGGQNIDANGGQNLGFGAVSSNNCGFGFDLKTDPAGALYTFSYITSVTVLTIVPQTTESNDFHSC